MQRAARLPGRSHHPNGFGANVGRRVPREIGDEVRKIFRHDDIVDVARHRPPPPFLMRSWATTRADSRFPVRDETRPRRGRAAAFEASARPSQSQAALGLEIAKALVQVIGRISAETSRGVAARIPE